MARLGLRPLVLPRPEVAATNTGFRECVSGIEPVCRVPESVNIQARLSSTEPIAASAHLAPTGAVRVWLGLPVSTLMRAPRS
jgi:hypothetical protein